MGKKRKEKAYFCFCLYCGTKTVSQSVVHEQHLEYTVFQEPYNSSGGFPLGAEIRMYGWIMLQHPLNDRSK